MPAAHLVSDLGEKALIDLIIRPIFNPNFDADSVGDDCAFFEIPTGMDAIASTDRVPSDLISFKAGVLDARGLGRYLGVLNLSDIAACGGHPVAILFNCGVPSTLTVFSFAEICAGLADIVAKHGAKVLGGDITSAAEISLSATVIGCVPKGSGLRRSGARIGDSLFVTRPVGLTPVALDYCLRRADYRSCSPMEQRMLAGQFDSLEPEIALGQSLVASNQCTSCMDNTDGIGQSLLELGYSSGCGFEIWADALRLDEIVRRTAALRNFPAIDFALGPGADFSLVGTLAGVWDSERARRIFGNRIQIVGTVTADQGVTINEEGKRRRLEVQGWNYFAS